MFLGKVGRMTNFCQNIDNTILISPLGQVLGVATKNNCLGTVEKTMYRQTQP